MQQYLDLGRHILEHGVEKTDRTRTGTISVFGYQARYNLQEGFPLVTVKDLGDYRFDNIVEELLWFISGNTHIQTLVDKGVNIWNRDAYGQYLKRTREHTPLTYKQFVAQIKAGGMFAEEHGELGRIYGAQWRDWTNAQGETIDQLKDLLRRVKETPDDRGLIVNAWNPGELHLMALRPCHDSFQIYIVNNTLSLMLRQRSCDYFLGAPYNIASYSLLTMKLAQCLGYEPGEFIHAIGDAHIYKNHIPQVEEMLTREPRPLPTLYINPFQTDLFSFTRNDFFLDGYDPHPEIKGEQSF